MTLGEWVWKVCLPCLWDYDFYAIFLRTMLGMVLFWPWTAESQTSLPDQIHAMYLDDITVTIDGRLEESVWYDALPIDNFTQRELKEGAPATEKTEVRLLYDDRNIYVGVKCFDSDVSKIVAKELKRDFDFDLDDNFLIIFDTYKDQRNGVVFVTNPNGARTDYQVFNNGVSINEYWNGVWDVASYRDAKGWYAEFQIPFSTLKIPRKNSDTDWGVNFERNIRRKREQVRWQGWNRDNAFEMVNQAGILTGLDQLHAQRIVEVKPYVIGGREYSGSNPSNLINAGADVNYMVTPSYRLNVTLNTDFAQVESDLQQVNITRFPLFFPELREFFLEGQDFFDFNFGGNRIVPFYSRRIGLDDQRQTVPILGGVRLLGKERGNTLGVMSIQTSGTASQKTTNYTTASYRKDLGEQSFAGIISANQWVDGRWHSTTGVNGRYATSRLFGKNFNVGGTLVQTYDAQSGYKKDAYAYRAFVGFPNDLVNFFASSQQAPAPFRPEVGLLRRSNFRENFAVLYLSPRPKSPDSWIRQLHFSPFQLTYTQYNDTRDLQTFEYVLGFFGLDTKAGESLNLNYKVKAEGLIQEFYLGGDIVIPPGTYWWDEWAIEWATFEGRHWSFEGGWTFGGFYQGRAQTLQLGALWRMSKYINLFLRYERNHLNLPSGEWNTDLIGLRSEYAVRPDFFGSVLTQWNSTERMMNFNFRLRYIPMPGADFYLIVNQLFDTQNGHWQANRGTVLGKLIWRFAL